MAQEMWRSLLRMSRGCCAQPNKDIFGYS